MNKRPIAVLPFVLVLAALVLPATASPREDMRGGGMARSEELVNQGVRLARRGLWQKAARPLRAALRLEPELASAHHNLGVVLAQQGIHAEAIAELRQAVLLDAAVAETHEALGLSLLQSGFFAEAAEEYGEAVRLDPGAALAHFNRGVAFERMQAWDEALGAYENARSLSPRLPGLDRAIGGVLLQLGRYEEAERALLPR
jgi:tetratricopeptide (TPR) repeat protein